MNGYKRHMPSSASPTLDAATPNFQPDLCGGVVQAEAMLARGDLLQAYDACVAAREAGDGSPRLNYLQVLALARLGETSRARRAYGEFDLAMLGDVDSASLGARIIKDAALKAHGGEQQRLLGEAAAAYDAVFRDTGDFYPATNAASLSLLAGDRAQSAALAEAVLRHPAVREARSYFAGATAAEALLLLTRVDEAEAAIDAAVALPDANAGARSTTCRQFQLIERALGPGVLRGRSVAARVRPASVLTYCGHMFRHDAGVERRLRAAIDRLLDDNATEIAFGSLACGADILIAEAVIDRGGQLNVVLPFLRDDFVRQSVEPGGRTWVERFEACLAAAAEVTVASEMPFAADDAQYAYAAQLAMGHARLRAANLATDGIQLAIARGDDVPGVAGTQADIDRWQGRGGRTLMVDPGDIDRNLARPPATPAAAAPKRAVRAMIFADFAGFSKLSEAAFPFFWDNVMGRVAAVLERHREAVCSRNSWGDALFAVTGTAETAALLALGLQAELRPVTHPEFGEHAGMRISAHLGPVYEATDPITRRPTFYGCEVNRTARIEPVTPPGQVYVTGSFGAVLAMEAPDRYELSYVGRVQLAKAYGEVPMYRLTELDAPASSG